ncbi:MAG: hypothetical protein KF684_03130 [Phycisphaeraceae bacterium]|nr:hypothetical protein [Phycisphaeraceae bacterium]
MKRRAALTLVCAPLALLGACAGTPERASAQHTSESTPDAAAPSLEVLASLTPAADAVFALSDPLDIPVALPIETPDDDARLACERAGIALAWIGARTRTQGGEWIPSVDWFVRAADDADATAPPDARGSWFALLPRASLDGADSLRVGAETLPIRRANAPVANARRSEPSRNSGPLLAAALDPRHRWRVALAPDTTGLPAIDDPALASYARTIEARVRVALDRLARHDATAADSLRAALTRTVAFDDDLLVPAFPPDDDALSDVLAVLLDERVPIVAAADRAAQYLSSQPRAIAWVIDDAGAPTGAMIGVAELAGQSDVVRAGAQPVGSCDPPTLDALLANRLARISLRCREAPSQRTVEVATADWSVRLDAALAPSTVSPPGLRIGPLLPEHTMRSWLSSRTNPVDARWATAALLSRRPGADDWQLYLECVTDPSSPAASAPDEVTFVFGPTDAPRAALRIRADSSATLTLRSAALGESESALSPIVRVEDDRWIAFIDLPEGLLEPDGTLLLGVERRDRRGTRTTWPRPAMPWDGAPSRLRIDLSSWPRTTRTAR